MNLDMTKLSKSAGGTSGGSNGGSNGVREDTLGEFLNTVFSYQSKEDIPNQLQTQANVQNLKQISRDTTAIIARYGNLDYVLQIDALVGDSSIRGFIHGYLYNPNIKDVILVSINTANGVATLKFNTDSGSSGGSSGTGEIISSTLEISSDSTYSYFKITNVLEEGFYDLVINTNVYTFTTTIYYNPALSNIGNATMGELGNYHYVFDFYTGNDYANEIRIYANVFKVEITTGNITISNLKELCELVNSFTGSYPTLTLYKRN